MTAPIDTSPEAVAKMSSVLRDCASLTRDLQIGANMHNAADWMDTLAARVADCDATLDRMLAQVTALSADADAARKAAAKNFDRAEAQSRLVADLNKDCTKLMADLHHETGLREDAEAKVAELKAVIAERDSFRSVLEGACYGDIEGIGGNTVEQSRALGEAVMHLTIERGKRAEAAEQRLAAVEQQLDDMRVDAENAYRKGYWAASNGS
jgi:ABC-type transporter Mla subunit MlaD